MPLDVFQTLPGLLTGFFEFGEFGFGESKRCFKPFQGFLPVSSGTNQRKDGYFSRFKPFQGFLPVSSQYVAKTQAAVQAFQTLPGLLTGFFGWHSQ